MSKLTKICTLGGTAIATFILSIGAFGALNSQIIYTDEPSASPCGSHGNCLIGRDFC